MHYWIVITPATGDCSEPVYQIYSEQAILAQYYDYWFAKMKQKDPQSEVSPDKCIQDWITVNWAIPATPKLLEKIITYGTVRESYL